MPSIKKQAGKPKTPLQAKLAAVKPRTLGPVWAGPESDADNGGITQGLLGRFLSCRERFRLKVVEGWAPAERYERAIEYGNMWHECEEALAANQNWQVSLLDYVRQLAAKFRMDQETIDLDYRFVRELFPRYVDYWSRHDDVRSRQPLLEEWTFRVPYALPSGRTVYLRGKIDSVDLVSKGPNKGVWIQENKTKSTIDQEKIQRQVSYDLQTNFYRIALDETDTLDRDIQIIVNNTPIRGTRYNVVRRPAHKSVESAVKKFNDDAEDNRSGEWFSRWNIEVGDHGVKAFKRECLDPILEQLCAWWDFVSTQVDPFGRNQDVSTAPKHAELCHFRFPYGVYNPVSEGGFGDLDTLMNEGNAVGLRRVTNLFPELQEG